MTDLNTLRKLAGLEEKYVGDDAAYTIIEAKDGKAAPKLVIAALTHAWTSTVDQWEAAKKRGDNDDMMRMYRGDAKDWKNILDFAREGNHNAAVKTYSSMDTGSRDNLSGHDMSKAARDAVAKYFGFEWNARTFGESYYEDEEDQYCAVCGNTGYRLDSKDKPCPNCKKEAEQEDEEATQDWYDKDGNPSETGAYDAGGHFDAERAANNSYEDEEVAEFKTTLSKGQHVEYKGDTFQVAVPNGPADFVGIVPMGTDLDSDHSVDMVRASKLMKKEDEEAVMMDIKVSEDEEDFEPDTNICPDCMEQGGPPDPDCERCGGAGEIFEAASNIACLKCDGVSTQKAWMMNDGTCPKCNKSTQGVAEGYKGEGKMLNESDGQDWAKLAKVISSVKTEEQYKSAFKYAELMFKKFNDKHRATGMGGFGKSMKDMKAMDSDLAGKAKELGIEPKKIFEAADATRQRFLVKYKSTKDNKYYSTFISSPNKKAAISTLEKDVPHASDITARTVKEAEKDGDVMSTNEAKDATVWDAMDHDKDESPESPKDPTAKVKVPASVKSSLKREMKQLRTEADKIEKRDEARAVFYNNTADAMEEVLDHLEKGDLDGLKRTQVCITKYMSPIVQRLPDDAYDFVTGGGEPKSLKDLFKKVKADKKGTNKKG